MFILSEFYNGNIRPSEKFLQKNSEYCKLEEELMERMEKLTARLNKEEKKLFEQIENSAISVCALSEEERYIEGFCTGVKFLWEIINYKSENYI